MARENYKGEGTHRYAEGRYEIQRMGSDDWYIYLAGKDTGQDFKTLKAARKWCKENP